MWKFSLLRALWAKVATMSDYTDEQIEAARGYLIEKAGSMERAVELDAYMLWLTDKANQWIKWGDPPVPADQVGELLRAALEEAVRLSRDGGDTDEIVSTACLSSPTITSTTAR